MKKIYILTAVFALLTLSLNAQVGNQDAGKAARAAIKNSKEMAPKAQWKAKGKADTGINAPAPTMNELLAGIKGMSSVMPSLNDPNGSSTSSGSMRAPLKINSDEYLVGPYTTNDFSTSGYGFPDANGGNGQQIYIFSDMSRSDFEQYDGDEIVGFRLALAGNSSQTAYLYEFYSWPYSTNGIFENANRHTWNIPEIGGAQPVTSYDDIVITTSNGYIGYTSIIVYNGNNVVTQWVGSTDQTTTPSEWVWTNGSHFASNNDGSYFMTYGSTSGGGIITIPGSLFENCTGDIRLVISAGADSGYGSENYQIDVNGDPKTVNNENPTFNQFTWTFSPTTSMPVYLELAGGQWHEFYLDEPIPFNVNDTIAGLYLGYRYWQWGSSNTGEFMYPVAVNPNSTNDGIVSYRIGVDGTTTTTQTLTSWSYADDGNNFPTTWTVPNHYAGELGGSYYFGGASGSDIVIPASDLQGNSTVTVKVTAGKENSSSHTISVNNSSENLTQSLVEYTWENVNASSGVTIHVSDYYVNISKIEVIGTVTAPNYRSGWWNENMNGDLAVQLILKSTLPKTDTPVITVTEGETAYTITATGNGTVTMVVGGQTYTSDEGSVSVTINRGNIDQTVAVSATAQEEGKRVSDPATQNVTVPALPITPTPVITYNETATEMVITATGQGTVTMIVDGQTYSGEGTVSMTIPRGLEDRTVTATATAVAPNHQPSAQAEETITIHEAGRSPVPTFTFTDNGDGSYTVTVTGTGEVNVYINDAEHGGTAGDPIATGNGSVSFIVEEHSQAMTLPLQATNQEEGLAVSRTAEASYTIPAMTITDDFKPLDPQPANANTPINLSKLMFVDRFSKEIPDRNNHPRLYDYYLQETQVRQRTSNSVEVEVKHTGSDGLGFYTLTQIDNDTIVGLDRKQGLKMNVRNAAMEIPLEPDPKVFFYTVERGTRAYPDQADRKWLGVLQRTTDGNYQETLNPSYDYEEVYPARPHIHYDTDTIDGQYNEYLTYVPVVWTMGFDRYNYMMGIDEVHNSYGAPKWRTGVADVNVETVNVERQLGTLGSTNWTEAGIPCSMYMIDTLTVKGFMPTVNTMPYEPYMFRVFVESKNGKLRGYKKVGDGAVINDGTHYEGDGNGPQTGPICVWSEYVKGSKYMGFTDNTVTFSRGKISEVDTLDHWIVPDYKNMMFAATDTLLTEVDLNGNTVIQKDELNIFVRFYYIVEGSAEGHTPGLMSLRGNRDGEGEAPAGYGSESPGTSPSPSTAVREISVGSGTVVSQTYYNVQGMESDQPFNGVNIVVTRYSDGTTRTSKVVIVR